MKAFLILIVTLRSFPQRLEQFVITAFPPIQHRDQINMETEIAISDLKPSANYLQLPMNSGNEFCTE